jgi:hypothetical protein
MRKKVTDIQTADTEDVKQQGRMRNAERDKKQKDALGLYVRGYSLQSISEMETIKVGIKTLNDWKKKFNWEEEKQLQNISPNEIKGMIRSNVAAIKAGKAMPYKPDDISKLASSWEKMDDHKKKAVYSMEAFDGLTDWLLDMTAQSNGKKREKNLENLQLIRMVLDEYINTLI